MYSVAGICECDNELLNSIPTDDSFFSPSIISASHLNALPINSRAFYHLWTSVAFRALSLSGGFSLIMTQASRAIRVSCDEASSGSTFRLTVRTAVRFKWSHKRNSWSLISYNVYYYYYYYYYYLYPKFAFVLLSQHVKKEVFDNNNNNNNNNLFCEVLIIYG